MKVNYLKKVDSSVIFTGEYMEIYIPKENFDKKISILEGEYLRTLGTFNFLVYPTKNTPREKAELRTLTLAFKIKIGYKKFFPMKTKLRPEVDETETNYLVFTLEKGDIFCLSTTEAKSATNTKELIFLIHGGNLPKDMKYDTVLKTYSDTCTLNGVNLNSQLSIFEYITAELCRDKNDLTIPFRKVIGKKDVSQYDYTMINLKSLPSLNSTFAALTFEDINQSIITSINKTRNNEDENESPIEAALKY